MENELAANPQIVLLDSVDSTNSEAMRRVADGAPEFLCIIASAQTAGRGREQRTWYSPPGAGLYMSIVFRPNLPVRFWPMMTMMAAVAVHDSLEGLFAIDCDIKWPNDILCRERKISGILAEIADGAGRQAVVLGIGINLLALAAQNPSINATSIENETGNATKQADVFPDLIERLIQLYGKFNAGGDLVWLLDEWAARSTYATGRRVKVRLLSDQFEGVSCGLELDGALRVRTAHGIRVVRSGDVLALRSDDLVHTAE